MRNQLTQNKVRILSSQNYLKCRNNQVCKDSSLAIIWPNLWIKTNKLNITNKNKIYKEILNLKWIHKC